MATAGSRHTTLSEPPLPGALWLHAPREWAHVAPPQVRKLRLRDVSVMPKAHCRSSLQTQAQQAPEPTFSPTATHRVQNPGPGVRGADMSRQGVWAPKPGSFAQIPTRSGPCPQVQPPFPSSGFSWVFIHTALRAWPSPLPTRAQVAREAAGCSPGPLRGSGACRGRVFSALGQAFLFTA